MELTIGITICVVIVLFLFLNNDSEEKKTNDNELKIEKLKSEYHEQLKGNDKRAVLDAGRAYYTAIRQNHTLTIYDELAIANDLNTMQQASSASPSI